MKKIVYLFSIICVTFIISCQSKTTEEDTPDFLFEATFVNNWLPSTSDAFLFISDESGNLIAEQEITGDGTYTFDLLEERDSEYDKLIISTIEIDRYYEYNYYVYMYSYGDIEVGENYTFIRTYHSRDGIGSIEISFENIPIHNGYLLSTFWDYRSSSSNSLNTNSSYFMDLYLEPDFLYLWLNTDELGSLYTIVDPVNIGDSFTVDLENLQIPENQTITFIPIGNFGALLLNGYNEDGNYHSGYHRIMQKFSLDQGNGEFVTTIPTNTFSDFRSSITLYEDDCNWPLYDCYYHTRYGNIPTEFKMIQADLEILDFDNQAVEISTSGDFDLVRSNWFYEEDNINIYWYISDHQDQTNFQIPELPTALTSEFAQITQISFSLYYVSVDDYTELDNYKDYLEIKFKSDNYFNDQVKELCNRSKSSGLSPYRTVDQYHLLQQDNYKH